MKKKIYIIVIEDELEVMEAVVHDLQSFEEFFPVETANTAEEANQLISQILKEGNEIGLILADHILPGQSGVNLLIELHKKPDTHASKKVLITGQAGHEETIAAINQADLNFYITKPWTKAQLENVVREELTEYVIESGENVLAYMNILNAVKLAEAIRKKPPTDH